MTPNHRNAPVALRLRRLERLRIWTVQGRVMLFGPRPLALFDRLWLLVISVLVVFLIATTLHLVATIREKGVTRACASYGADQVAFDKNLQLLALFGISENSDSYRSLQQARDQKRVLRSQLHCPPYPAAPVLPEVPGD